MSESGAAKAVLIPIEERAVDGLLAVKAEREAQILRFKVEQGQHGLISLDAALEWLQESNRDLLAGRIRKLWMALSDEASRFKIGGPLLPSVTIVQDDYSPPVSEFTTIDAGGFYSDLTAARKTKMYQDPQALRELLKRLWLPQTPLRKIFQYHNWPTPPWLVSNDAAGDSDHEKLAKEKGKPGRRKGNGSYAAFDHKLFKKMDEMLSLLDPKVASPEAAARALVDEIYGTGAPESKIERLAKRYRNAKGSD